MAFPTVVSRADPLSTANATSHTVNFGSTPSAGDLLIVVAFFDGAPGITWPTAQGTWTQLYTGDIGTSSRVDIRYKTANGEGSSITLTTDASERMATATWVIDDGTFVGAPEIATATGNSANPDSPSLSPSWGAKDSLWLSLAFQDGGDLTISVYPTSYTQTAVLDATGGAGGVTMGRAERQLNAASDNPSAYTFSNSKPWIAATIAIRPRLAQSLTETLALADEIAKKTGKTLTDALSLVDAVATAFLSYQAVAESASLAETLALKTGKTLTETLTFAEVLAFAVKKDLTESLTLADAVATALIHPIAVDDPLALADAIARKAGKTLTDTLTLADAVITALAAHLALTEGVTISDTVQPIRLSLPTMYTRYAPRPLITLTVGAATKRYSTETLITP